MNFTQRTLLIFLVLVGLTILVFYFLSQTSKTAKVKIGATSIKAELAQNLAQKTKGLGYRDSLEEGRGMLFEYPTPARYSFWMGGMRFDLDFIFINNGQVVDLVEKVPAPKRGEAPEKVNSKEPFTHLLEVNAGTIEKNKIKVGDPVSIEN